MQGPQAGLLRKQDGWQVGSARTSYGGLQVATQQRCRPVALLQGLPCHLAQRPVRSYNARVPVRQQASIQTLLLNLGYSNSRAGSWEEPSLHLEEEAQQLLQI